jgi:hypothetical protein
MTDMTVFYLFLYFGGGKMEKSISDRRFYKWIKRGKYRHIRHFGIGRDLILENRITERNGVSGGGSIRHKLK